MERIRELRDEKKLTQLQLALKLEVSQETISGYEIGKAMPPAEMLIKLSEHLCASVDYILGISNIKIPTIRAELTDVEQDILFVFKKLSPEKQSCVYDMMKGLEHSLLHSHP